MQKPKNRLWNIAVWLMPVFCMGCATFTPESRQPDGILPITMPRSYPVLEQDAPTLEEQSPLAPRTTAWWTDFESQDLNALMDKALSANFDILTAWATLRQSQATLRQAQADLLPSLDGSASTGRNYSSTQTSSSASRTDNSAGSFGLGLAASYEVDLWGRLNAEQEAELLRLKATAYDVDTVRMTVAASVATAWASLLGNREELAVVQEQIAINNDIAALQKVRFLNGQSTSLDVLQQEEVVAALHADIPSLEQEGLILRNELALLQGTLPTTGLAINEEAPLPHIGALPQAGLPIQLLDARPDIKAAWARLEAADWDVSKAHANRYPSIALSASMLFNAAESSLLFSNWVAALAGSLTMPLFDGGKLEAEEERVKAVADGLVQSYAKTVATAMQEVSDALAIEQGAHETLQRLQEQLVLAKASRVQARNSYFGGATDYLNYVTQLKNVQTLERSIAKQKTALVQARISVNRTLGGLTFPQENVEQTMQNNDILGK